MSTGAGQKIGEIIITALWPVIWVFYVLVSAVVFLETAAVYLSWGIVMRLERLRRPRAPKPSPGTAG